MCSKLPSSKLPKPSKGTYFICFGAVSGSFALTFDAFTASLIILEAIEIAYYPFQNADTKLHLS